MQILEKNRTYSCSRSSKVIDFLNSNFGRISYRFRDIVVYWLTVSHVIYWLKIATPCIQRQGWSRQIYATTLGDELWMMGCEWWQWKNFSGMFNHFDRIHVWHWHWPTDGIAALGKCKISWGLIENMPNFTENSCKCLQNFTDISAALLEVSINVQ